MSVQSTYGYKARDKTGTVVTGTLIASSPEEVNARLRAEGKFVFEVEANPMRVDAQLDRKQIQRAEAAKRVKREDVIAFCQQLSVMLETGVPLSEAMEAFSDQTPSRDFREVLVVVRDDLDGGEPLSTSMMKWPRIFPSMMISLMRASEASGTMALMLGRVGEYLSKERQTARQVKGALAYPLFMMVASLAMTVFLMAFVLPRFATIYGERAASLPTPTKILLAMSNFITTEYLWYGPLGILAVAALVVWLKTLSGRRAADWVRLNLPGLRVMYRQLYITRASRTMATLLGTGVNVLDVIDICRGVTNNAHYDRLWDTMADEIRNGRQMSDAVFQYKFVGANVASMISAGERSGRLPEVMERISQFSQEELDASVRQVTAYIEPVMIILMGVVIGSVALALLLPIFSMGKVMAGG